MSRLSSERLAGVGVAGDRDATGPALALGARAARVSRLVFMPLISRRSLAILRVDAAAVELDLRLTGATRPDALTAGDPATGLAGHRLTPATQARQQVLSWASSTCALPSRLLACWAKMSRISGGAVDDLDLDDVLERAALARARARCRR